MAINVLVSIILTLTAFMLIAGAYYRFMSKGDDATQEALCQSSVALKSTVAIQALGTEVKPAPILCKTLDKEISGTKEEIMQQMADKMARCWWMFGEGRYKKDIFRSIDIFGGEAHCFQCSTLLVDDIKDEGEGTKINSEVFSYYLSSTKYPKINGTYLDYIQTYGGPGYVLTVLTPEGISSQRGYAIAFKPARDECPDCWKTNLGASAGMLVGTGLMLVPLGVTQIAGGVILAGSATVGTIGSYNTIRDVFTSGPNMNTIYLVDMNVSTMDSVFGEVCQRYDNSAGK